jgi:hypothetical protein
MQSWRKWNLRISARQLQGNSWWCLFSSITGSFWPQLDLDTGGAGAPDVRKESSKAMKSKFKLVVAAVLLLTVFSVSFFAFYKKGQTNATKQPLILTSAVINKPLPHANLIDINGKKLDDVDLRQGKVVIAFMMPDCEHCDQENEFLKSVINSRHDVRFVYVIPFGNKDENLKTAHEKYSLEPFFDVGSNLSRKLQLHQVPLKIFLQDGIIKQTFIDSAITAQTQQEFKTWLASV